MKLYKFKRKKTGKKGADKKKDEKLVWCIMQANVYIRA